MIIGEPDHRYSFHGERVRLTPLTEDPDPDLIKDGSVWLRIDLDGEDQLATLRMRQGSSTVDFPIFELGASEAGQEEVYLIDVGNTTGFIPLRELEDGDAFRFQHDGQTYAYDTVDTTQIWNVLYTDTDATAADEQLIITDADVTLPDPAPNASILVDPRQRITVEPQSGQLDGRDRGYIEQQTQFVSDGSDWYVSRGIQDFIVIPDSAILHYQFDEGSGTTVSDSVGDRDATLNGPNWISNNYIGGHAVESDGVDDTITAEQDGGLTGFTDLTVLQTVDFTPDDNNDQHICGVYEFEVADERVWRFQHRASDDSPWQLALSESGEELTAQYRHSGSSFSIDGLTRLGFRWQGGQISELIVDTDTFVMDDSDTNTFSQLHTSSSPDLFLVGDDDSGRYTDFDVYDDFIIHDEYLSDSEIQEDYDRQPWS